MATFRPTADLYDRIGRIWLITAGLMVLLACARWLQVFAGIDLGVPAERNGVDTAIRVLDGPYAFFLAGPLLLTVPFWLRRGQARWVRWLGVLLLVVVIVLDRRTVWLAILVGVAVLLLRGRRLGRRAIALVVAASIVTVLAFAGDVLARDQAPPGTVTSTGTRRLADRGLVGPRRQLVGEPGELARGRAVRQWVHPHGGRARNQRHPHNFYIETMIRAGLGGLIALIALTVGLLRRVWRVPVGGVGAVRPRHAGPAAGHAGDLVPHVGPRSRTGDRHRHRHRRRRRRGQGSNGTALADAHRRAGTTPEGPGSRCRTRRGAADRIRRPGTPPPRPRVTSPRRRAGGRRPGHPD